MAKQKTMTRNKDVVDTNGKGAGGRSACCAVTLRHMISAHQRIAFLHLITSRQPELSNFPRIIPLDQLSPL